MDSATAPPRLNEANGRQLALGESVGLTTRFANTLYQNMFIVAERLAVDVIIGSDFMNRHVEEILCNEQRVRFRYG